MDVKTKGRLVRVLVAKIGLDGHNRGAQVVAHGLREAGMEVIYTGIRQIPSAVARAAVEEDVDVIGISSMVGAHLSAVKKLMRELEKFKGQDIPVIVGGIIPEEDYEALLNMGVSRIFPPGAEVREIIAYIDSLTNPPEWVPEVPGTLAGNHPEQLHLIGSRCQRCDQIYFPTRRNCPHCMREDALTVIPLSARGTLQAFAVSQVAPLGFPVPHAQGYIDLGDGGPRIFSLLTDVAGPSGLEIGDDMALKIINVGKDKENRLLLGYRFRPLKKEI